MATTINSVARDYHLGYDTVFKLVNDAGIKPTMTIRQGARNIAVYDDDIANLAAQHVAKIAAERAAKRGKRPSTSAPSGPAADATHEAAWRARVDNELDILKDQVHRIAAGVDRIEQALNTLFAPAEPVNEK